MARESINGRTYTPQGQVWDDAARDKFFAGLQQGQAVEGREGWRYEHTGSGWSMTNDPAAPAPGSPPPTPGIVPPVPGQGPTTPPGEPQRPSAIPPSPPPATQPAPQIPLGPTTGVTDRPTPPTPTPTNPDVMTQSGPHTGPGLIDASRTTSADPIDTAFRSALLEILQRDPTQVSVNDPALAPQSRAFRASAERGALRSRAELMERASAEGVADSEATRAAARAASERADQAIGAHDAALVGEEMTARRDQLNTMLQIANARGMQQEANDLSRQIANLDAQLKTRALGAQDALSRDLATLDVNSKQYLADLDAKLRREGYGTQERLAQLDAEVRRLGINTQGNIGSLEIALRRELGIGELNLGLLSTLLQNNQVNNRLGFDIGQWASVLNKDALLGALSGGVR